MSEKTQDYKTHRRLVPGFHFLTFMLAFSVMVGGIVYACCDCTHCLPGTLFAISGLTMTLLGWYARQFAIKAQDRAIRAEENFRHFILTGKPLDKRLKPSQIVALRFAPDEELPELAIQAAEKGLKNDDIKKLIQKWKADHYRA